LDEELRDAFEFSNLSRSILFPLCATFFFRAYFDFSPSPPPLSQLDSVLRFRRTLHANFLRVTIAFRRFDTDRSGDLDQQEMYLALKVTISSLAGFFASILSIGSFISRFPQFFVRLL